jgi:uncharacterized protein (DUF2267 family)
MSSSLHFDNAFRTEEKTMNATPNRTLHSTEVWVNDIMHRIGWQDEERALRAIRAVLHALRDRLDVNQVAHLGAQLPQLVRGIYYEGWHPAGKPLRMHREEFLDHVEQELGDDPAISTYSVCRAVLGCLQHHVSAGELRKVRACLPEDLRELWP